MLGLDKDKELRSLFRWDHPDSEARLIFSETKLAFFGSKLLHLFLTEGLIVHSHLLSSCLGICDELCEHAASDMHDAGVAARVPRQVQSHLLNRTLQIFGLVHLRDEQD